MAKTRQCGSKPSQAEGYREPHRLVRPEGKGQEPQREVAAAAAATRGKENNKTKRGTAKGKNETKKKGKGDVEEMLTGREVTK